MQHQLEDKRLTEFTDWSVVGKSDVLKQTLYMRHNTPTGEYESPHELQFSFTSEVDPDFELSTLPSVRYGFFSPTEARIYAVQMPSIKGKPEHIIDRDLLYARAVEDEEMLDDLVHRKDLYEWRREYMKRFHRPVSANTPAQLLSLTATLAKFQNEGIKTVKFAVDMLDRAHEGNPELDAKIRAQKLQLLDTLGKRVKGIQLEDRLDQDGYFVIHLDGELEGDRPILQEVIKMVQK